MNFNEILLKNGLRRLDHPDRYAAKKSSPYDPCYLLFFCEKGRVSA